MGRIRPGLVMIASLCLAGPVVAQGKDPRLAALDRYAEQTRVAWRAPAVGVVVVVRDSVVFAKGYGVLEAGKPARADENTIFAIGSSTKAFTTASLAMLVDAGLVKWDDPAGQYLPGWELADPWVTREVTIKDLVTHRIWGGTDFSREEILRRQRYIGRIASFRSAFGYNNHMFLAAGQAIERIAGKTWDDFVKERIFSPLGMTRATTSTKPLAGMSNVAPPHIWIGDSMVAVPWHNIDNIGPAGSINASAREMGEWLRLQLGNGMYRGRRLVSEAAMREMHAPQTVIPLERWYASLSPVNHQMVPGTHFFMYGMGWFLQDYKGRYLVHHGGSIDGMRALVAVAPDQQIGIVILTNQNPSNVDEAIAFKFFDLYFGGETRDWGRVMLDSMVAVRGRGQGVEKAREAARVLGTSPTLPIAKYAGVYADSAYGDLEVKEQSGKLTFQMGSYGGPAEHWNYDTFQVRWNDRSQSKSLVTFRIGPNRVPTAVSMAGLPDLIRKP